MLFAIAVTLCREVLGLRAQLAEAAAAVAAIEARAAACEVALHLSEMSS